MGRHSLDLFEYNRFGRTVEVEGPVVERWAEQVASQHGFADVSHTVEIFGTCGDCAG